MRYGVEHEGRRKNVFHFFILVGERKICKMLTLFRKIITLVIILSPWERGSSCLAKCHRTSQNSCVCLILSNRTTEFNIYLIKSESRPIIAIKSSKFSWRVKGEVRMFIFRILDFVNVNPSDEFPLTPRMWLKLSLLVQDHRDKLIFVRMNTHLYMCLLWTQVHCIRPLSRKQTIMDGNTHKKSS